MAKRKNYERIALDEVGYVRLADIGAEFLFQVISDGAEKTALIVTTNRSLGGAPHDRFNAGFGYAESGFQSGNLQLGRRPFAPHDSTHLPYDE